MGTALPAFTPVEESLYITLAGRAIDSRAPRPLLADTTAAEVTRKIGYDLARFPMAKSKVFDIAVRAKKLDEIVRSFVARHPNAVVLELGAGLDSRMFRINPPTTVDWYDIDFAEVVATRERSLSLPSNAHQIAADLTDPRWLAELPQDRPVVAVGDGLVAFIAKDDFTALLNRITSHFPGGEIAFNGYTRFHVWAIKHYRGTGSIADVVKHTGFDDPHEPETWDPKLTLAEEILLTRVPEIAELSFAMRLTSRLAGCSTSLSRRGTTVLRYRF